MMVNDPSKLRREGVPPLIDDEFEPLSSLLAFDSVCFLRLAQKILVRILPEMFCIFVFYLFVNFVVRNV